MSAPFTSQDRDGCTILSITVGRRALSIASISKPSSDGLCLASLYAPTGADHVDVWCESRSAATALAEFHARMCARSVGEAS